MFHHLKCTATLFIHLHTYIASEVVLSLGNTGLAEKVSYGEVGVTASVFAESKQNIPVM